MSRGLGSTYEPNERRNVFSESVHLVVNALFLAFNFYASYAARRKIIMKRKMAVVLSAAMVASLLTGCGGSTTKTTEAETKAATEATTEAKTEAETTEGATEAETTEAASEEETTEAATEEATEAEETEAATEEKQRLRQREQLKKQ